MATAEPQARANRSDEETLLAVVRMLADGVGPRRPTSRSEAEAARRLVERLEDTGIPTGTERFDGFSTFGEHLGLLCLLGVAPAFLPRHRRGLRAALAALAAALAATETRQVRMPLTSILSRRPSQNVVATIEPSGVVHRTVCLSCHVDSSRSGLLFDPRFVAKLRPWLRLNAAAIGIQGAELVLDRRRAGRPLLSLARTVLAANLALLLERELRGEDVPGANDNASGCAVVVSLGALLAKQPLRNTRVILLLTGCEEAGTLGARAFLRSRDTRGWLFLNFDNVGGSAPLRYLRREGLGPAGWDADPALLRVAELVAGQRPELALAPSDGEVGLLYDATPVLANGGRALTLIAYEDQIPDYHWPTDTVENVDPQGLSCAFEAGREMLAAIDRGEADL